MKTIRPERMNPDLLPEPATGYPAGRVIAVVLLALFLGALFDADSLVASVSSERFGTARDVELALVRPFRTVSDALDLNLPHKWLASIAGTNQPSFSVPAPPPPPSSAISQLLTPHVRTTRATRRTRPPRPAGPRPISAANPLKVWLAGDSLMGAMADAFMSHVTGDPAVRATTDVQIGTGLARPDVYNWPGAIASEMRKANPTVVILAFGANDAQDMQSGGHYYARDTPAWAAEYGRRVAQIMDEVAAPGRTLIWILMPPVARPLLQQTLQITNPVVIAQARLHPGVLLVNTVSALSTNGAYTMYLNESGHPVQVRTDDGIHMTPAGAGRVLPLMLADIRQRWLLR